MRETSTYLNAKSDRRSVDEMQLHKLGILFTQDNYLTSSTPRSPTCLHTTSIETVGNAHNAE